MIEKLQKIQSVSWALVLILSLVLIFFVFHRYIRPRLPLHNNAASQLCLGSAAAAHGIIFGKAQFNRIAFSPSSAEGHVAVFGGSGSGKTSAILIPTLRSWDGNSFVIDISGDISSNISCPNKIIYEPGNTNSAPYDTFAVIDDLRSIDDQNEALEQLAFLLMPDLATATANAKYFQDGGRNILTAALIAFYHAGKDFPEICKQIVSSDFRTLFQSIDLENNPIASAYISNFVGVSEQNTSGCKQNCDAAIKLFALNQKISSSFRRPRAGELAVSPFSTETHNIFILIPDDKRAVYAPVMHIITAQTLSYFSSRPPENTQKILLCLDEFASLGDLGITEALRKLRKKHVRIMILTQSLSDIDDVYGNGAHRSMLDNFAFTAILGVGETQTQEYFAKLIGHTDVTKKSYTKTGFLGAASSTTTTQKDFIIPPAELGHLGSNLILLYPDGHKALKKAYYFQK